LRVIALTAGLVQALAPGDQATRAGEASGRVSSNAWWTPRVHPGASGADRQQFLAHLRQRFPLG